MKIIGVKNTSFTGSDGTQVEGMTFYATEAIDAKRGHGERAERFFLSKAKLAALDFTPAVGQETEVLYNRYGKIAALKLVDPDDGIVIP